MNDNRTATERLYDTLSRGGYIRPKYTKNKEEVVETIDSVLNGFEIKQKNVLTIPAVDERINFELIKEIAQGIGQGIETRIENGLDHDKIFTNGNIITRYAQISRKGENSYKVFRKFTGVGHKASIVLVEYMKLIGAYDALLQSTEQK